MRLLPRGMRKKLAMANPTLFRQLSREGWYVTPYHHEQTFVTAFASPFWMIIVPEIDGPLNCARARMACRALDVKCEEWIAMRREKYKRLGDLPHRFTLMNNPDIDKASHCALLVLFPDRLKTLAVEMRMTF